MTRNRSKSLQRRTFEHSGRTFSNACLSCENLARCCETHQSDEFDGASPTKKSGITRRRALKILGVASAALALAPFIDAGQYLVPSVPSKFQEQLVAKTTDIPVNGSTIFWFPFTTDPTYTNLLIHLPSDLAKEVGQEFVAYNRTCIHLQCLVSYLPGPEIIGCPCHGSLYSPTDSWPVGGPAAEIGRYLPYVQLRFDGENIYAVNINLENIGYGNSKPPPW